LVIETSLPFCQRIRTSLTKFGSNIKPAMLFTRPVADRIAE